VSPEQAEEDVGVLDVASINFKSICARGVFVDLTAPREPTKLVQD
jgi:hypothetical protein